MFVLLCDECGGRIILDELTTTVEYAKDMDYLVDEVGELVEKSISNRRFIPSIKPAWANIYLVIFQAPSFPCPADKIPRILPPGQFQYGKKWL